MIDLSESISFLSLTIVPLIILITINTFLLVKNKTLAKKYKQLSVNYSIILMTLSEMSDTKNIKDIEQSDGFMKFVSESREWAFSYIEDVQNAMKIFEALSVTGVREEEYWEAYEKLMSFLPKEEAPEGEK